MFITAFSQSAYPQTFSSQPWATFAAHRRTQSILIDGDLKEWKSVRGFSLDQKKYLFKGQGMSAASWKGTADLSGRFKVLWDEDYVYIAIEVWDDQVTPPHGSLIADNSSGSWDDDGIEIMFDNDGCGKSRYFIGDSLHHEFHIVFDDTRPFLFDNFWVPDSTAAQPMFTLPNGEEEPLAYAGERMAKNNVTERFSGPPYFGNFQFKRTKKGYNLELKMKLPGATMKPVEEGGHPIGFDVCINDNDEGRGPLKQQMHWSGENGMFWRDCKYFGTLLFVR